MATLFYLPFRPVYDGNMRVVSRAKAWFTLTGSNTPSAPFANEELTTPLTNPVRANSVGRFPTIWLDPAKTYRVRIYDSDGIVNVSTPLEEYDPYDGVLPGTGDGGGPVVIEDVTGLAAALAAKSPAGHTHDDRYYTKSQIDAALAQEQNVHALLTSLVGLDMTGKQGYALVVNGAENGFELAELTAAEEPPVVLSALVWVTGGSVAENAPVGTVVGTLGTITAGSTLTLTDDADGLFSIDGGSIEVAAALDYDTATSHNITIRETLTGAVGSPRDTVLTVTLIDISDSAMPSTNMDFDVSYVAGGPPIYNVDFEGIHAGDYLRIQQTETIVGGVGNYTTPTLDIEHQIMEQEVALGYIDPLLLSADGYAAPDGGNWGERTRWERDNVDPGPWSELTGTIDSSTTALVSTSGPNKSTNFGVTGAYSGSVTANVGLTGRVAARFNADPANTQFHAELVLEGGPASAGFSIGCSEPWNGVDASGTGTNFNSSIPGTFPGAGAGINGFSVNGTKGGTSLTLSANATSTNYTLPSAFADGAAIIVEVDTSINKVWIWYRTAAGVVTAVNAGVTLASKIPVVSYRMFIRGGSNGSQPTLIHANIRPADFLVTPTSGYSYYA